jgi:hypothetical protein
MSNVVELMMKLTATDEASPAFQKVAGGVGAVEEAANKTHGPLNAFGGALGNVAQMATGLALGGGLIMLPGKLLDFAKAAAEDEAAAARVSTALKTLPGDFAANSSAVERAIASGQKLAFSDDDVRDSFVKLAAATGDTGEAIDRQRLAMDLARGAHIPLNEASKLLGKVTDDNLQVFKRMGITLTDVSSEADVMAAVQAKFAGQAEAYANSTAGQFDQAKIAFDETTEALGYALMPALTKVARFFADSIPVIQAFVTELSEGFSTYISPVIDAFIDKLTGAKEWLDNNIVAQSALVTILTAVGIIWAATTAVAIAHTIAVTATAVATEGYAAVQWLLNVALSANPIGLVIVALAALTAGLVYAYNNSEDFRNAVDGLSQAIGPLIELLGTLIHAYLTPAIFVIGKLAEGFAAAGPVLQAFTNDPVRGVGEGFRDLAAIMRAVWTDIVQTTGNAINGMMQLFNALGTAASQQWNAVVTTIHNAAYAIGQAFSSLGYTVSQAWSNIQNSVRNAVNSIASTINRLISGWNNIRISFPSFNYSLPSVYVMGHQYGGGSLSFGGFNISPPHIPSIPIFDQGAIVSGPTLAALAMNGRPEAVVPLDRAMNIAQLAEVLSSRPIVVQVDGREIARVVERRSRMGGLRLSPNTVR